MNSAPPKFHPVIRGAALLAMTGFVLAMFLLPPPASTLALLVCMGISLVMFLERRGYQPRDYLPLAGRVLKAVVTPFTTSARVIAWVNRQPAATIAQAAEKDSAQSVWLARLLVAAEIGIIVFVALYATTRFRAIGNGLQLSGGETEWLTNSAYAASNGLREYGRIPLWQPLLEFGEPLIDNPFSFVLNPFSAAPSLMIGAVDGLKVSVILTTLVAGLGGWAMGWAMGFGALGRVLLALLLVGKGNMHAMFQTGYYQLAASQAYFPWIAAGAIGVFRLPTHRWPVGALAIGTALLLFAGNIWYTLPMAIGVAAIAAVYVFNPHSRTASPLHLTGRLHTGERERRLAAIARWVDWRGLRRVALAGILGLGICAISLIPMVSNHRQLNRHPPEVEAGWVVPLWRHIVPFYFTADPHQIFELFATHTGTLVEAQKMEEVAEFYYSFVTPGWFIALIAVLLPFYQPRWNRLWWVLWGLAIFFTLWGAGGQPLFLWLYARIPALQEWRFVGRALAVASFWVATLVVMRVDSLWTIIRTTDWGGAGIGRGAAVVPVALISVLVAGSSAAAYQVNEQWNLSPNSVINPINEDDVCVSWLREKYPDRELTIWRWGYQGITTLMNNRARTFDILADFEMSPMPSTIGVVDLTSSLPEFAMLTTDVERRFMSIQGYELMPSNPNFHKARKPCTYMYQKADALSYAYTISLDDVTNAPRPSANMYGQRYVTLDVKLTTPITTYARQPDNITLLVEGDLMDNRILTVQERAFPGWRVTIDGRPAKLESVGGQIGVVLPRDLAQHVVYFEYRPPLLVLGGWITLAASLMCALYLLGADLLITKWLRQTRQTANEGMTA